MKPGGSCELPSNACAIGRRLRFCAVCFRVPLLQPQFSMLVLTGWWITTIVAWFSILLSGRYPPGLYGFGVGALRWLIRVEAYMLLMVDDYPPFSLD